MASLKDDKKFTVYCHTNKINGHQYIGITSSPLQKRWGSNGINYKTCCRFYNAIKHYGWNNFNHEILEEGLTKEEAEQAEIFYIKEFNTLSPNGYNLTSGGSVPTFSEESRQKMSRSQTGKKVSKETRAKMSKSRKGHEGYNKKPVWMCDKETHERLIWFDSAVKAGEFLEEMGKGKKKNISSHICHVCNKTRKSTYGYYWEWGDDLSQA